MPTTPCIVPTGFRLVPEHMVVDDASLQFLHGLSQPDDQGHYSAVRLSVGDGHAGHGLYASMDDYPDEGCDTICTFDAPGASPQVDASIPEPFTETQRVDWLLNHSGTTCEYDRHSDNYTLTSWLSAEEKGNPHGGGRFFATGKTQRDCVDKFLRGEVLDCG